jgi:hypothetical protein
MLISSHGLSKNLMRREVKGLLETNIIMKNLVKRTFIEALGLKTPYKDADLEARIDP